MVGGWVGYCMLNPGVIPNMRVFVLGGCLFTCEGVDQSFLSTPPPTPSLNPHHPTGKNTHSYRDPDAHKKFLKPSPLASELVDRCIECGFCESNCPSRDITLTPR